MENDWEKTLINGRPPTIDLKTWRFRMNSSERHAARNKYRMKLDQEYKEKVLATQRRAYERQKNKKCKNRSCDMMINPRLNSSGYCVKCFHNKQKLSNKSKIECKYVGCKKLVLRTGKGYCREHYFKLRYNKLGEITK